MMKKLLLVDGNSMLFRAYYATAYGGARMTTKTGLPTNAVFGFANMIQKALDLVQPDEVLVAFDAGRHTFRHDLYADYKGGRKPAPDDLVPQFRMARDYLTAYGIRYVEMPDIEADDLIGTMARKSLDCETTILTSDHDLLQLSDETTTVMLMKKGLTEMDAMTPARIEADYGISPVQIIDLKGLMGDASDNYPGIPGVGEKTAVKLLKEYGTVESVLEHDSEIKGALGKKVREGHESALLSKKLATIRTDVDVDLRAEDCVFTPDYASLVSFLESMDMKMLASRYAGLVSSAPAGKQEPVQEAYHFEQIQKAPAGLLKDGTAVYLADDIGMFLEAELHGIALSDGTWSVYMTIEDVKKDEALLAWLAGDAAKTGYDIKRSLHVLKTAGLSIHFSDDVMIMASLSDSTLTSTEKIMNHYALVNPYKREDVYGTLNRPKMPDIAMECEYGCAWARNIRLMKQQAEKSLQEQDMMKLYHDMEMPLTYILFEMEDEGIRCEKTVLNEIATAMQEQIDLEQKAIYEAAGHEFNINSPKQLATVLYDEMGILIGKKHSTSADILEEARGIPMIDHVLNYRKLQKINSTYAEGLQKYICKDGRIHTVYNQCATQTGRLSSSEPNLQNISVRDEQGKIIRKAFLPQDGCVLMSCDYHQIELRMLAAMAKVPGMMDAFNNNVDVHTRTAMDIFGIEKAEDVTPQERRRAKTVNFGIVYGISDFGLAQQLGVSRKEAADFISTYYEKYPQIRTYMDNVVKDCEKNGYVTTLCGRRRRIPEIHDKNHQVKEFGKRAAMNAPIQGSAADLIKIAMIRIDKALKEHHCRSTMILQVHDELIFNVVPEEKELVKKIVEEGMCSAMELGVPLTVETSFGKDWYEAK
ncbi:MAG: DNA polymerase I [Bulleidia sp.]|nr:DNA polymerase I [Bulleidia sp.]